MIIGNYYFSHSGAIDAIFQMIFSSNEAYIAIHIAAFSVGVIFGLGLISICCWCLRLNWKRPRHRFNLTDNRYLPSLYKTEYELKSRTNAAYDRSDEASDEAIPCEPPPKRNTFWTEYHKQQAGSYPLLTLLPLSCLGLVTRPPPPSPSAA